MLKDNIILFKYYFEFHSSLNSEMDILKKIIFLFVFISQIHLYEFNVPLNYLKIEVFYETRCPDSQRFLLNQIIEANQKFSSYIDFILVSFGKANVSKNILL